MAKNIKNKSTNNNIKKKSKKTGNSSKNPKDNKVLNVRKNNINLFLYTFLGLFLVLILWIFLSSDIMSSGQVVEKGDFVSVWYVGRKTSGEVFDTNIEQVAIENDLLREEYKLLEFVVGAGQMIKGFDEALVGMRKGEKKIVEISPDQAYGNYRADLVNTMSFEEFENIFFPIENAEEGSVLRVQFGDGTFGNVKIDTIGSNFVRLDMNHELAGKKLIFEIELDSIN